MKRDINFGTVEGVSIAITKPDDPLDLLWQVHLINNNAKPLNTLIVVSKGYSGTGSEKVQTSTLRHVFAEVAPKSSVVVESIDPEIFGLTNEFWVSYYIDGHIYDKKFVFVPDSIVEDHVIEIAAIQRKGVLHK
jgi:hypothetical protein